MNWVRTRRRVAMTAVAALMAPAVLGVCVSWVDAQAASGNIPGIPLPAATVSGSLGGPIYDVVYSVVVPAGHVLFASMTGTPGTDFDLYLFDSSASNIYADPPVGQVAASTGPTSAESITYPTASGGTFYLDLSGATNVEGTYTLHVQIAADTTPPRVSLSLDGGAPATNSNVVAATVVAMDDLSGVGTMQFSTNGSSWQAWEAYQPTVTWSFPVGDGTKTLWVRVRDRAGNVSATAQASIRLDTSTPVVLAAEPDAADPITSTRPTIRITFSEPMRVSSWSNFGVLLQDANGTLVYGTYGWDATTDTGTFTPNAPLVAGATYTVSLGPLVDEAGNPLGPVGSWVIHPVLIPRITLTAGPTVLSSPGTTVLAARIEGAVAGPLSVERSVAGAPWALYAAAFTDGNGTFTAPASVDANTFFRIELPATAISADTFSNPMRVLVRRQVSLAGLDPSVTRRVRALTRQVLTAVVAPTDPPVPVTFSVYRYVSGRGYVLAASVTRTTVGGHYTFSWTPGRGSYYVRLTTRPTPLFANGISPAYRFVGD